MIANIIQIALGDQPGSTIQPAGLSLESFRQFVEDVTGAEVVDAVDGVEAKRVDVIFGQPVQRVVDNEAANAVAPGPVKLIAFPQGV